MENNNNQPLFSQKCLYQRQKKNNKIDNYKQNKTLCELLSD